MSHFKPEHSSLPPKHKKDPRGNGGWKRLTRDLQSYVGTDLRPWSLKFCLRVAQQAQAHPGLLAVVVFRYGQWVKYGCTTPIVRQLCAIHYLFSYNWIRTRLQIEVPASAHIGPGFRIYHYGSILIHGDLVAGENLYINHGVVIGSSGDKEGIRTVPQLGNNVKLKVGAKVFGPVELGDNVIVGAGAVVIKSAPENAVLVGVPAKVIRIAPPDQAATQQVAEKSGGLHDSLISAPLTMEDSVGIGNTHNQHTGSLVEA